MPKPRAVFSQIDQGHLPLLLGSELLFSVIPSGPIRTPLLLPKISVDWPDYLPRFGVTTLLLCTVSHGEFRISNEALHHHSSTKLSLAIVMSTWVPKYFQGVYVKTISMGMKEICLNFDYFWLFLERSCLFIGSTINVTLKEYIPNILATLMRIS